MKISFIIFLFLFILLFCLETDFNIVYNSNYEGSQFINLINNVFLEVNISFGSHEDTFKAELDLESYCITIPGIELENENIKKFNKSLSTTFKEKEKLNFIFLEKFFSGLIGEDTIKLGNSRSIKNIRFVIAYEYSYSFQNSFSYIGLGLSTNQINLAGINILEQLKNNSIIDKQLWYLEFEDYNKGKFVLGKYPHEINTNYKEKDKYQTYLQKTNLDSYRIKFDEIYYGYLNNYENRIVMQEHKETVILLSTRLIYSTYEYGESIYNKFFRKKIEEKKCFIGKISEDSEYSCFYCQKNININEMENLNFYIRDTNMTFTFTPKDLFYEHNDYFYYLVVYKQFNIDDSDKDTEWKLGLQFLQKYVLTFDRNDRIVYYYSKNDFDDDGGNNNKDDDGNNNKDDDKKDGEKSKDNNSTYIIIIVLLIVIFICSIAFLVLYIKKIKPRKVKANELDEGYDYETKKESENGKDNFLIN